MTANWSPYLEPGEAVVWEGKPRKGIQLWPGLIWMILGVPLLIASYFLLTTSPQIASDRLTLETFALKTMGFVFLVLGVYLLVGEWIRVATRHRRIRYALSDRRAYIGVGGKVEVVPLNGHDIETKPAKDGSGKVLFGIRDKWDKLSPAASFDNIDDVEKVAALIRKASGRD